MFFWGFAQFMHILIYWAGRLADRGSTAGEYNAKLERTAGSIGPGTGRPVDGRRGFDCQQSHCVGLASRRFNWGSTRTIRKTLTTGTSRCRLRPGLLDCCSHFCYSNRCSRWGTVFSDRPAIRCIEGSGLACFWPWSRAPSRTSLAIDGPIWRLPASVGAGRSRGARARTGVAGR
jgi:hypothetical protein